MSEIFAVTYIRKDCYFKNYTYYNYIILAGTSSAVFITNNETWVHICNCEERDCFCDAKIKGKFKRKNPEFFQIMNI